MANTEAINAAISKIAEKIIAALDATEESGATVGFHRRQDMAANTLIRAWIGRCGPGEKNCWYHLAGDRDNPVQQPIEEDCVSGRLVDLQLLTREYKGKENQKIVVTLEAGKALISVTTGLDTVAGRSVLRGLLGHLEKGAITGTITLQVKPGDSEGTVLVSVLQDGEWAYSQPLQDPEHAIKMIQHQMKFEQRAQQDHSHEAAPAPAAPAAGRAPKAAAASANEELPF